MRRTGYETAMWHWDLYRSGQRARELVDLDTRDQAAPRSMSRQADITPAMLWALEVAEMTRLCNNRPVKRYARQ